VEFICSRLKSTIAPEDFMKSMVFERLVCQPMRSAVFPRSDTSGDSWTKCPPRVDFGAGAVNFGFFVALAETQKQMSAATGIG
jgi:hypothetical protein